MTLRSSKRIYKGRIFEVAIKDFRLPGGRKVNYAYVDHPGAVVVIPLINTNKIILIWQYRAVIGKYIFELPAGTLEKGEKPLATAKRELIEETGYKAGKMSFISDIYPVPGYSTEVLKFYKAEKLRKTAKMSETDEVIEEKVLSKQQVRRLYKNGKIVDAKTIAGLAMIGWI